MIVDTSALIAIAFKESGHERILDKILAATPRGIGAPTLVETGLVLSARLGRDGGPLLARFRHELDLEVVPFLDAHWQVAVQAFWDFGKGRHPAGLNLGDCLSYATARVADQPLLFVGDDFARTDVLVA